MVITEEWKLKKSGDYKKVATIEKWGPWKSGDYRRLRTTEE